MAVVSDRAGSTAQAINYYERALEADAVYGDGRSIPLARTRLGLPCAGHPIRRRAHQMLADAPSAELFTFYRCHRASLPQASVTTSPIEANTRGRIGMT